MTPKRGWLSAGRIAAVLGAILLIAYFLTRSDSQSVIRSRYASIHAGMSRVEVRELMLDAGLVMYTDISDVELMHVDGKYLIALVYEPRTGATATANSVSTTPQDDWVVKEKLLLELGRGGPIDDTLIRLKLRSSRMIEHERASNGPGL